MNSNWCTWANAFTLIRTALIPSAAFSILFADWQLASTIFVIAIITDVIDGRLARRYNQASNLGGLFDHVTDAVYVSASCWAFSQLGLLTPWLWPLILFAFAQYMLDSRALAGQPLRASMLGRCNGIAYFVVAGMLIGGNYLGQFWIVTLAGWFGWVLVASSLISIADRAYALFLVRDAR